jgi:hypothetical protein
MRQPGVLSAWGRHIALLLLPCAFLLLNGVVCGADKKKETEEEKEAKRAAEEEAEELATSGLEFKGVSLAGTVQLNEIKDGDTANTVAGSFITAKGTFLLKFNTMELRKAMMARNNKEVLLVGKIRNDGKYFVVMSVPEGNAPPPVRVFVPGHL